MTVYKFSNVSGFKNYQKYNDFLAGNPAVILDKGSMYPLGTFTLSSNVAEVNFDNIPQTYTHLQIRGSAIGTAGNQDIRMQVNGVTASSSYTFHELRGDGSTVSALGSANTADMNVATNATNTTNPAVWIVDILDYKNTNKNKVIRSLNGVDRNGSGTVSLISGMRLNTSAITSIRLFTPGAFTFNTNTVISLYGINA